MRLARLYLSLVPLILASCEDSTSHEKAKISVSSDDETVTNVPEAEAPVSFSDEDNDRLKIIDGDPRDLKETGLPILPPIILLDFANDLDNSSSTEEKTKRTVDSSLGHGFGRNNFFTGKYNYYFPAGKSGTSVSIEESVTPFLPKTIIEAIKPITEKTGSDESSGYFSNSFFKADFKTSDPRIDAQPIRASPNRFLGTQPVYGQRTKLYKPSQIDYGYQTFGTTPRTNLDTYTTARPDHRSSGISQNSYTTQKSIYSGDSYQSGFFETSPRPYKTFSTQQSPYVTPTASPYQATYSANAASHYVTPRPFEQDPTTRRPSHYPTESPLAAFADLPRYTIENGIRYENKIVWKYPDGKVSQSPPMSYVNAYNEFLTKQRIGPTVTGYENLRNEAYQLGGIPSQAGSSGQTFQQAYQSPLIRYTGKENRYQAEAISNIHSKSPAQFPNDQPSVPPRPSQFVSSSSSQAAHQAQEESYESFQGQYGQKTRLGGVSASDFQALENSDPKDLKDSYGSTTYTDHRPVSKYAINSPNPEYTYATDSPVRNTSPSSSGNLFTPSGQLSPKVLSKYSTQAQKYLTKVFASSSSGGTSSSTKLADSSTNQENLFGYNPSLIQYIRDPASILKAQPTFIQAGNSLIPVIILRVDGVPPIKPKATPNINLKALLQQYLTQYAGNVAQNVNYEIANYGKTSGLTSGINTPHNPLYELTQLAQDLSQYSRNPTFANHFAQRYEDEKNSYENSYVTTPSYPGLEQNQKNLANQDYPRKVKQRIKNVQIIEDPRFTSYKVNS